MALIYIDVVAFAGRELVVTGCVPLGSNVPLEIEVEQTLSEYRVTVDSSPRVNVTFGVSELPGDELEILKSENAVTSTLNATVDAAFPSEASIVMSLKVPLVVRGHIMDPVVDDTVNPVGQFLAQR